jgi:hypothetical protein
MSYYFIGADGLEASFLKQPTGSYTPFGLIIILIVILISAFVIIGALYYNWKYNEAYALITLLLLLFFFHWIHS